MPGPYDVDFLALSEEDFKTAEKYCTNQKMRSLMMCNGEWCETHTLSEAIEACSSGDEALFSDDESICCHFCGFRRGSSVVEHSRRIRLVTLLHGSLVIIVNDWTCRSGYSFILFNGECSFLFPATKHSAYTTEFTYMLVYLVC